MSMIGTSSVVVQQPEAGAFWLSHVDGNLPTWKGQVISCYFHPSKPHSATTIGKLGTKRSEASAGHWAISVQTRGLTGNKTMYNHW